MNLNLCYCAINVNLFKKGNRITVNENYKEDGGNNEEENVLILSTDKSNNANIVVHRKSVKHLKLHQIDGICFMYNL